jgi:hypothetical protein
MERQMLGESLEDVILAWRRADATLCGYRGWLYPAALHLGNRLTYFWSGLDSEQLEIQTGPQRCRRATEAEKQALSDGLAMGEVFIFRQGTWSAYADRRHPRQPLHEPGQLLRSPTPCGDTPQLALFADP